MACRFCKGIAVARRARFGVAFAARGNYYILAIKAVLITLNAYSPVTVIDYLPCIFAHELNACLLCGINKAVSYIVRVIRHGENAVAALCFQRHTEHFKKCHSILGRKAAQRGVHKSRIRYGVSKHCLHIAVVGDIAPALSRNAQLFADNALMLYQQHARPTPRKLHGAHKPCRTAAYYHRVRTFHLFRPRPFRKRHSLPISSPDAQSSLKQFPYY